MSKIQHLNFQILDLQEISNLHRTKYPILLD